MNVFMNGEVGHGQERYILWSIGSKAFGRETLMGILISDFAY